MITYKNVKRKARTKRLHFLININNLFALISPHSYAYKDKHNRDKGEKKGNNNEVSKRIMVVLCNLLRVN